MSNSSYHKKKNIHSDNIFLLIMSEKKTLGRRKVEMKPIERESNRLVTFSKRRTGLFKKASEISTLCGVEIAIIVLSLAGKPFSFGSPDVESVLNRFFKNENNGQQEKSALSIDNVVAARRELKIIAENQNLEHARELLASEKIRKKHYQEILENFYTNAGRLDRDVLIRLISKLDLFLGMEIHATDNEKTDHGANEVN